MGDLRRRPRASPPWRGHAISGPAHLAAQALRLQENPAGDGPRGASSCSRPRWGEYIEGQIATIEDRFSKNAPAWLRAILPGHPRPPSAVSV